MSALGTFDQVQVVPQVVRAIRERLQSPELHSVATGLQGVRMHSRGFVARRPYHLHLLPIAVAAIVFGTAVPVELRPAMWGAPSLAVSDFAVNVLLYAPLGLALWRRPIAVTLTATGALSVAIEVLQIWYVERDPSLIDVVANVLGVAVGVIAAQCLVRTHRVRPDTLPIDWRLATSAAIGTVGLLVLWALPAAPSNFANWDADFELLLGNEHTADRPWRGTIAALAILPAPLSRREVRAVEELVAPEVRAALVARGAYVLPAAVTLEGQEARRLPADVTRHLFRLAVERNALTVIARVATADVHQDGPARLVSFSLDQFRRNFDLGQEGRRLVFRVRTPTSGPNGMNPHTETSPVLETNRVTTIAATFDGTVARVYVDGHLRGRTNLAAASCRVPTLCDADLPLATGALGGLLTVVALATVRPRSQMRIILLAALAAVVGIALLHLTHATPAPSPFEAWRLLTVLVGAVWVGLATSDDLQAIESEIRTL
jgi:Concanavalin A-like lectin/glucanases superfamily